MSTARDSLLPPTGSAHTESHNPISKLQQERDFLQRVKQGWLDTVDAVGSPMVVHDWDFRIVRANRAYATLAGMDFTELIGLPYYECFPKIAGPLNQCRQCLAGVTPHAGETIPDEEFVLDSGDIFVSHVYVVGNGEQLQTIHVFEDVTERRQLQEALARSERHYRKLIEEASDAFYVIDQSGAITYRSASGKRLTGYDDAEILGKPFSTFIAPDSLASAQQALGKAIKQSGWDSRVEIRVVCKDGNIIDVEATGRNMLDDPDVNGIVVTLRNETERRRAERALRDSEETLRSIATAAQDAIIELDNAGCVTFWNGAAERIFGYRYDEAIGQELHPLLAPAHYLSSSWEGFTRFRNSGEGPLVGKTLELTALKKGGIAFPIELSLSATSIRGRWHAVGIVRDITSRKEAERQLQLFRTMMDQSNDLIVVVDPTTLDLIDVNERTCQELGYTRSALLLTRQ